MLCRKRLMAGLPIRGLGQPLYFYSRVGSTNAVAAELAQAGTPHGTLIVADEQWAGRGRAGRKWLTPAGSALALSVVLRPAGFSEAMLLRWSGLGTLALLHAMRRMDMDGAIKWPNDVLLAGRKVGGVLAECVWTGSELAHLTLGIGINVRRDAVPRTEDVDFPATCLEAEAGKPVDRVAFLYAVLEGVGHWFDLLEDERFIEAWDRHLAWRGREVVILNGGSEIVGSVCGLAHDGRLILRTEAGESLQIAMGECHLRPVDRDRK
jgi:BirA family biotin operon repressor/biotin-[acetyl-CoA-carboxylase] ligase